MAHRPRGEMIAETRAKLIGAARKAFGEVGYAEASMDDFTAEAGLTRGALYHHFGGKQGLLEAVVVEMDREMSARIQKLAAKAADPWQAFVVECTAYIEMALEPEIQRIVHLDGPAVLGDPFKWSTQDGCIAATSARVRSPNMPLPAASDRIASSFSGDDGEAPIWWRRTCTSFKGSMEKFRLFSSTSRITPSAALLSANGSLLPVGFSSIAQKPVSMSSLSASATAIDTGSVGIESDGPCGL